MQQQQQKWTEVQSIDRSILAIFPPVFSVLSSSHFFAHAHKHFRQNGGGNGRPGLAVAAEKYVNLLPPKRRQDRSSRCFVRVCELGTNIGLLCLGFPRATQRR